MLNRKWFVIPLLLSIFWVSGCADTDVTPEEHRTVVREGAVVSVAPVTFSGKITADIFDTRQEREQIAGLLYEHLVTELYNAGFIIEPYDENLDPEQERMPDYIVKTNIGMLHFFTSTPIKLGDKERITISVQARCAYYITSSERKDVLHGTASGFVKKQFQKGVDLTAEQGQALDTALAEAASNIIRTIRVQSGHDITIEPEEEAERKFYQDSPGKRLRQPEQEN